MTDRILHAVPAPTGADDPLLRDLIGGVLRRARLEQGRTLREVAETAQVSLPYLSEIERGRKEPSSEVLAAVYRALGLQLIDLVGDLQAQLIPQRHISVGRPGPAAPPSAPRAMLMAV